MHKNVLNMLLFPQQTNNQAIHYLLTCSIKCTLLWTIGYLKGRNFHIHVQSPRNTLNIFTACSGSNVLFIQFIEQYPAVEFQCFIHWAHKEIIKCVMNNMADLSDIEKLLHQFQYNGWKFFRIDNRGIAASSIYTFEPIVVQ